MKDNTQSQFISSSAASTTIAIFMFVTVAFVVLLGASQRKQPAQMKATANAPAGPSGGPQVEVKAEKKR